MILIGYQGQPIDAVMKNYNNCIIIKQNKLWLWKKKYVYNNIIYILHIMY